MPCLWRRSSPGWRSPGYGACVDTGTAVDEQDYQVPFGFTGKIDKVTVKLGPEELTAAEREMLGLTLRAKQ